MTQELKAGIWLLSGLMLLSLFSFVLALAMGSSELSASQIWQTLSPFAQQSENNTAHILILELRLPRALAAFAVGAMLSLAGLLMQVLLRNPLADPYVLGVSGGASTAALLALLFGFSQINIAAFLGALLAIYLVFFFSRQKTSHLNGAWNLNLLLLAGIVMAAGWGALISFILIIAPPEQIHGMLFWLMGDLSYDRPLAPAYAMLMIGTLLSLPLSNALNVMTWGDVHAASLGVQVNSIRLLLFFISSLLTAGAVSLAGSIGFVGLVVPHLLRLMIGSDHRILIPASLLAGGSLLVIADTLARTLLAPQQLPVGIITALIGIPVFLFLLRRQNT